VRPLRFDIQALRALAVTLVVVFHFWPQVLGGGFVGVDVFFVISGFLITGHLLRDVAADRFSITEFWARRIRRLIPASFLVLAVTALVVWIYAGSADQSNWFGDIVAATGYFENWSLAFSSVDYLALGAAPSPVQHFWSLSAEEQFYFLWPLLIAVGVILARVLRKGSRAVLLICLLALTTFSFAYSIYFTHHDAAMSYFVTPTRVWEFGVGAVVAFLPVGKLSSRMRDWLFVIAFVAILTSALVIKPTDAFPGALAAWPVLATAAAIWSAPGESLLTRILGFKPVQFLGDISYSVYLWHWPILILTPLAFATAPNPWMLSLELIATVLLAWVTRKFVELPMIAAGAKPGGRASRPWLTFVAMGAAASMLIGVGIAGATAANARVAAGIELADKIGLELPDCVGAKARQADGTQCSNPAYKGLVVPSLDLASQDSIAKAYPQCPGGNRDSSAVRICKVGDRNSTIRIALVGDSHANQFTGVFDAIGKEQHWSVDVIAKGGCPLSYATRVQDAILTKACAAWVTKVVDYLGTNRYAAIVTSMKSGVEWVKATGSNVSPVSGVEKMLTTLAQNQTQVLYLKDNPHPLANILDCLRFSKGHENASCSVGRATGLKYEPALEAIAKLNSSNIREINLDDVYCAPTACEPIIGNVIVYRDDNHLTNIFANTLRPLLTAELVKVLAPQG
jgi:peptidoglycan/LPS O-acetylase OafA/YrhL